MNVLRTALDATCRDMKSTVEEAGLKGLENGEVPKW
jgi:hypothetical protein